MSEGSVYKPRPLSGYLEWLPEVRLVEQRCLDRIRSVFERYGFSSIETPAVEELEVLAAKGETADKEIYTIQRLNADQEDANDARLGLHYDLTVPLARYVAQHFGDLVFPFKRYQIQKVWRGERPQEGRYREFCQCDIDVVNPDQVPLEFDAEMLAIVWQVAEELSLGELRIQVSNRKILEGFLEGLGVGDQAAVIRALDKLDKIGAKNVGLCLQDDLGLSSSVVEKCLAIAAIKTNDSAFAEQVRALGVQSELLDVGLSELSFVLEELSHMPEGSVVADLSIARGFDYYTGSIYEARLVQFPQLGSVAAGGRYDDLAGSYINRKLPGVGISLGFSRIFAKLVAENLITVGPKSPTRVLVAWRVPEVRESVRKAAAVLRGRGLNVETYHCPDKLKKQIRYADKKMIPYVWFVPEEKGAGHQIKRLDTGEQIPADLETWTPGI